MDLISNLPKHILYEILSRMPEKDAARTSILSKTLRETWSTSPILILKVPRNAKIKNRYAEEKDPQQSQVMWERNYFLNHVVSTLQRFHDQGLAIKHFKLYLDYSDHHVLSPLIDYWMELVCMNELEVLHFSLFGLTLFHGQLYCLPHKFLESKSLVRLILYGCIKVDKAFLNHPIKFTSLKMLSLSSVTVEEEQMIQNLFSSCPLIEYVTLKNCPGLKSVSINNLPKLKGVEFIGIQEVFVDAPNLECFQFHYFVGVDRTSCKINFDNCRNLRDLCLSFKEHVIITSQWLIELLHKFPLLERLELEDCTISTKMHISTMQLKVLKFINCCRLEEACIDAPKLDSFSYHCCEFTMPTSVSFSNNSDSLEFDVRIHIGLELDFLKLREFLQNIKPSSVLASLVLMFDYLTDEFNPYVLQGLSDPPSCIKHLEIHYFSNLDTVCLPLPIGLLWTCRPAIMSIMINSTLCVRRLVKLFCEMLMGEIDCWCNSGHTKCWWHGLKDVEVTRSSSEGENVVVDFKTLLDALPTLSTNEEIRFRLGT